MEEKTFNDEGLQAELERRLDLMTSPDYEDPAREDFNARDFLAIAVIMVAVVVAFVAWGY